MSLAGNLQDLDIGDIVQIINLSRKSGFLFLRNGESEGLVVFRQGQVVRARSSCVSTMLGEVLRERGVIKETTLNEALAHQEREGFKERLGTILISRFGVATGDVETVAQEQIREIMLQLATWRQGTFDFELKDDVETVDDVAVDPVQFVLAEGLDARAAFSGTASPQEPAPAEARRAAAVIVDDDPDIIEHLTSFLVGHGWEAVSHLKSEEALISIDAMYRDGLRPTVIIDLIMPRMDGSGILGGLELLELLHRNFTGLLLLAMADYHNLEAERKVSSMGLPFLLKPRKSDIAEGKCHNFCTALLHELERTNAAAELPAASPQKINLGAELLRELGEEQPSPGHAVPNRGISLLRSMLDELNSPLPGGGVVLLVLRFAAEFMNRAIIFSVTENEFLGLGQFGIADDMNADSLVRSLRIPLDQPSLLREAMHYPFPVKLSLESNEWNRYLFDQLGGTPDEVFVGPVVSGGKPVAILYGDNLPGGAPLGDTDSLEIFLSQAGVAMEKLFLERRLRQIDAEAM